MPRRIVVILKMIQGVFRISTRSADSVDGDNETKRRTVQSAGHRPLYPQGYIRRPRIHRHETRFARWPAAAIEKLYERRFRSQLGQGVLNRHRGNRIVIIPGVQNIGQRLTRADAYPQSCHQG